VNKPYFAIALTRLVLQKALDGATLSGEPVYLPPCEFTIDAPLILVCRIESEEALQL
jgi:hypothetical protein